MISARLRPLFRRQVDHELYKALAPYDGRPNDDETRKAMIGAGTRALLDLERRVVPEAERGTALRVRAAVTRVVDRVLGRTIADGVQKH